MASSGSSGPSHGGVPIAMCFWLLVISLLVQALYLSPLVTPYDEGLILYGAAQVAEGNVPYRDFWSLYGPASFYGLGVVFHLFGETVLNARIYDAVFRALIVLFSFLIVQVWTTRRYAFAFSLASLILLLALQQYEFPVYPATACSLCGVWLATGRSPLGRNAAAWLATGVVGGIAIAYRTDLGVYAMAACLYAAVSLRDDAGAWSSRSAVRRIAYVAGGAALVVVPTLVFLLATVPWSDLYEDFVHLALRVYPANRTLPFPTLAETWQLAESTRSRSALKVLVVYVPLFVAAIAAATVAYDRVRSFRTGKRVLLDRMIGLEVTTILLILFILKGMIRVSIVHMGPALIVSIVVCALLVLRLRSRVVRVALLVVILALVSRLNEMPTRTTELRATIATGVARWFAGEAQLPNVFHCPTVASAQSGCFRLDRDRARALAYITANSRAGDVIYVGTGRHDKLFLNNVELYFLSGTHAPTRWHDLHPGVQTEASIQQEMIGDFERRPPVLMVLNSEWDDMAEPNLSRNSSGVRLLDDYIVRHFEAVERIGSFTMLKPAQK